MKTSVISSGQRMGGNTVSPYPIIPEYKIIIVRKSGCSSARFSFPDMKSPMLLFFPLPQRWQHIYNLNRLQTHGDDFADQADYVFLVVVAVGVAGGVAVFVLADAVLVYHPFHRAAVAALVVEHLRRDAAQGQEIIVDDGGLVFREFHRLHAPVEFDLLVFDAL